MVSAFEHRKEHFSLLVVGFFLVLINLSGDHLFYKTNTLKLSILVLANTVLAVVLITRVWRSKQIIEPRITTGFLLLLVLPLISTLPGLVINGGTYRYFSAHEYVTHLMCVLWAYFLFVSIKNIRSIYVVIWIFAFITIYLSLISILQFIGYKPLIRLGLNPFEAYWASWTLPFTGTESRVASTAGNPNYLAGIMIQLTPVFFSMSYLLFEESKNRKFSSPIFFLLMGLFSIVTCLMTGSRGALIAIVLSGALFLYLQYRIAPKQFTVNQLLIIVTILVLSIFALLLQESLLERLLSTGRDSTLIVRFQIWKAAFNSILDSPVLGHGLGTSYSLFFTFSDPEIRLTAGRSFVHAHSNILETLQEAGLFGALVYGTFWCGVFGKAFAFLNNRNESQSSKILVVGIVSGLVAVLVQGLISVAPRMVVVRIVSFTLIACLIFIVGLPFSNQTKKIQNYFFRRSKTLTIFTAVTLLILLLVSGVWMTQYASEQWRNAYALSRGELKDEATIEYAGFKGASDVFLLDRAIDAAQLENEHNLALSLSQRLQNDIAHYRDVDTEIAYSLYSMGRIEEAHLAAEKAYLLDRYNVSNLQLLIFLAGHHGDLAARSQYTAELMRFHLCRSKEFACLPIKLVDDSSVGIFDISVVEDEYQMLIDARKLDLFVQSSQGDESNTAQASRVVQLITKSNLLLSILPEPVSERELIALNKSIAVQRTIDSQVIVIKDLAVVSDEGFISDRNNYNGQLRLLNEQLRALKANLLNLADDLPDSFDFQQFWNARKFLISFSTDYANALQFDKLSDLNQ